MVSCSHLLLLGMIMVSLAGLAQSEEQATVHIVHISKDDTHLDDMEAKHIEILASVCNGSQDKAKEMILYHYKHGMRGFSAKLTPAQVTELSTKPGVISVSPQGVAHLHGGAAKTRPTANNMAV